MDIKMVLFDLDGTLLPMNQDKFTKGYFKLLTEKMAHYGYDSEKLVDAVWKGTAAMVKNNGQQSNENVFWENLSKTYGNKALADKAIFNEFYAKEFQKAKNYCGYNPMASKTVTEIKNAGLRTVLATNPIFPMMATESRIEWAGLKPSDFELYTTYENTGYCKPNPNYYIDICTRLKISPNECLMVGNDVTEDMIAKTVGMKVFLHTDYLINKDSQDISVYPRGGFEQLLQFIRG